MKRVIHWFRRDLRLTDNTALSAAAAQAEEVLPVFILEDALRTGPDVGAARVTFLLNSVRSLQQNLEHRGYKLIIVKGRSEEILPKICLETGAEAVFCNRRYEPYAQQRDNRIFNLLNAIGVGFEVYKDAVVWEGREILTSTGTPFTVFTPYSKAWKNKNVPAPKPILRKASKRLSIQFSGDPLPDSSDSVGHPMIQEIELAGERAARDTLKRFLSGPVNDYATQRNFPGTEGTSRLSPHLRCGNIGIRTILSELATARQNTSGDGAQSCDTFLNELIWREFYLQVLTNFPHVMKGCFRPAYDTLAWENNERYFRAWCQGETGYPIVDAALRCLNQTGWMHNRLRMITAMFLTKDLLIDWKWGERYFMQQLVDGDMAANNGGWQWSAGTGTDAAPYFRIFNPTTQAEKFDPEGIFVRKWLPELTKVPSDFVHSPWEWPGGDRSLNYPKPIVQHDEQRIKALAMYQKISAGKAAPRSEDAS